MKSKSCVIGFVVSVVLLWGSCERLSASPGSSLLKGLSKYLSKDAAREMGEKLLKEVGKDALERLEARVVREGGQVSLEKATNLIAKHGSDVIRAIDNVPNSKSILKSLDELPTSTVSDALQCLARGPAGRELAELTEKYGTKAILAELKHPGIGSSFVKTFGDDGFELCASLSKDQAIAIGRHLDGLATANPTQKTRIAELIKGEKDAFFKWLGEFVNNHPGKILTAGVILANSETLLGPEGPVGTVTEKIGQGIEGFNWVVVAFVGSLACLLVISLILRMRRIARLSERNESEPNVLEP